MALARRYSTKSFHSLYTSIANGNFCVYCGELATTKDHFIPLSVMSALSDLFLIKNGNVLLPCCPECNYIAGSLVFKTVAAKRRYIQQQLRKKHSKLLASPPWHELDIDELGYTLRTAVLRTEAKRQCILRRLKWKNRSNPANASLAKIRFSLTSLGNDSVQTNAETFGMVKKELD